MGRRIVDLEHVVAGVAVAVHVGSLRGLRRPERDERRAAGEFLGGALGVGERVGRGVPDLEDAIEVVGVGRVQAAGSLRVLGRHEDRERAAHLDGIRRLAA